MAKHYEVVAKKMYCPWCMTLTKDGAKCPHCGYQLRKYADFDFGTKESLPNSKVKRSLEKFDAITNQNTADINSGLCCCFYVYAEKGYLYEFSDGLLDQIEKGSVTACWLLADDIVCSQLKYDNAGAHIVTLLKKAACQGSSVAQRMLITGIVAGMRKSCGKANRDLRDEEWVYRFGKNCYLPRFDLMLPSYWERQEDRKLILEELSDHGIKWAKYVLGYLYCTGNFGEIDLEKGLGLIREAASTSEGDPIYVPLACQFLSCLYYDGICGVKRDVDEAMRYLSRCCLQNVADFRLPVKEVVAESKLPFQEGWAANAMVSPKGARWADWQCRNATVEILLDRTDLRKDKTRYNYDKYSATPDNYRKSYDISNELDAQQIVALCKEANGNWSGVPNSLRITYADNQFKTSDGRIVFSKPQHFLFIADFAKPLSKYDFSGTGTTFEEMVKYCAYLRRYILWDRKVGAELILGEKAIDNGGECPLEYSYPIKRIQVDEIISLNEPVAKNGESKKAVAGEAKKSASTTKKTTGSVPATKSSKKTTGSVPATKSSRSETSSAHRSSKKKRWAFVLIGLLFGVFGLHFLYARRKGWFFFYWLMIVANIVQMKTSAMADVIGKTPYFALAAALTIVGSIFFMKKDGDGNRM